MTIKIIPATILLADDHGILREGLRILFSNHEKYTVIGEATNGREAVQLTQELSPDLVIMDIGMPELNGIEATRQICYCQPDTRIIALSAHAEFRYVLQIFQAGALGYVQKSSCFAELLAATDAAMQKRRYISQSIAGTILDQFLLQASSYVNKQTASLLSAREREVLQLLAEGYTAKEISQILHLKPYTVESYRRNIMEKLNLHGIAQLTRYAIREGISMLEL